MTNEQTALLLRQIAGRVRALAAEVEPLIESRELMPIEELRWTGTFPNRRPEMAEVGHCFAAVQRILDLAELLRSDIPEIDAAE